MNKYELALVLNARLEEEARTKRLEEVKELVSKFGGDSVEIQDAGRKQLAYEIQKMNDGHYYFIKFSANPTCPPELEQRLRIMEDVLRYLCIKVEA